jgi:hypothetical protein
LAFAISPQCKADFDKINNENDEEKKINTAKKFWNDY